jgi:hypothetical protein
MTHGTGSASVLSALWPQRPCWASVSCAPSSVRVRAWLHERMGRLQSAVSVRLSDLWRPPARSARDGRLQMQGSRTADPVGPHRPHTPAPQRCRADVERRESSGVVRSVSRQENCHVRRRVWPMTMPGPGVRASQSRPESAMETRRSAPRNSAKFEQGSPRLRGLLAASSGRHEPGNRLPEPGNDPGKPAWGSQDWAETMGDDIPSDDQPGDDFDTEDTRGHDEKD